MSDIIVQNKINDFVKDDNVEKGNSIKNRLRKVFILLSVGIILLICVFSVVYFYFATRKDAVNLIRNKVQLAEIFMESQKSSTYDFAKNIADDKALQIGLDMKSSSRISNYLYNLLDKNTSYYVTIFDSEGKTVSDIGKTKSSVFTNRKELSSNEQLLLREALGGTSSIDTINVLNGLQDPFPCYIATIPVQRNDEVIGVVMVRFIFEENNDFFTKMSKDIEADIAIYVDSEPVIKTAQLEISQERYNEVAHLNKNLEDVSFSDSGLNEFRILKDNKDKLVGILHVYVDAFPYLKIFITVVLMYVILAVIVIIIVLVAVLKVSDSILNPLGQLLTGVNSFRSGNLEEEVHLSINDEIGRLGDAFNELRNELSSKISTIETMNSSLEQTVAERTEQINALNEKMKHYLSPQLYASIAGGDRDVSIDNHYRKKLTVFFSDVKNFTATTDSLEPEDVSNLLNSYLDRMAQIAEKYRGTIDKYVGDAVMVFFGDPEFTSDQDHAVRAVKMAMEMQLSMIDFRDNWKKKGIVNPFHVRMGINTGYCTIGNFGSEMKMDYTIIGNNVNLAARYEAACEPDSILISEDTYMLVKDEIECEVAGTYNMKGIPGPVKGYRPLRIKNNAAKKEIVRITENEELIVNNDSIDIKKLTKEEKRSLLINLKNAFDTIAGKSK